MGKIDIEQSVGTLDFGCKYDVRIQRVCRENRIVTIRDLCQWFRRDLMRTHDLGHKSVAEIEDVLAKYDLRLGMLGEELDEYAGIGISRQDEAEAALWEQRRYEIAKDICVHRREAACIAVQEADELIRFLKGGSESEAELKACRIK